jgi:hypothetical protein
MQDDVIERLRAECHTAGAFSHLTIRADDARAILDHINLLALDSAEAKTRLVEAHHKLIEKDAAITALTARHDAAVAEVAQIVAWLRENGEWPRSTSHAAFLANAIAAGAHKETTNDD